jgi:ABC-type polar amino acid transport system ATPase subunit
MEGGDAVTSPVLQLRNVSVTRGRRTLLRDVSFNLDRGDLVALMGPSGSGKTTILRTIAALDSFDAGTIVLDDVILAGGARPSRSILRRTSRKVGMVFQFHCLFEHLSALKNICLAPVHAHGVPASDAERHALDLLKTLGVDHRANALPRELSGGEAQRVAIARALAVNPPLLLMDEPTASLDSARKAELGTLLRRLTDEGRTLLVATHDEDFTRDWATRVLRLGDGSVTLEA